MNEFIIASLLIALTGCHGHLNTGSSSTLKDQGNLPQPEEVRITCRPLIEIKRNDTLVIEFTEYPGRAYSWELSEPDSLKMNLKLMKIFRHALSNKADPAAKAEFYFVGLKTGSEILTFRYLRPWERNKPAADSCVIKVKIK